MKPAHGTSADGNRHHARVRPARGAARREITESGAGSTRVRHRRWPVPGVAEAVSPTSLWRDGQGERRARSPRSVGDRDPADCTRCADLALSQRRDGSTFWRRRSVLTFWRVPRIRSVREIRQFGATGRALDSGRDHADGRARGLHWPRRPSPRRRLSMSCQPEPHHRRNSSWVATPPRRPPPVSRTSSRG
jgi:hypothetical protein